MKVKMLVSMAGSVVSLTAGDAHECSEDEANRLIAAGYAEAFTAKELKDLAAREEAVEKAKAAARQALADAAERDAVEQAVEAPVETPEAVELVETAVQDPPAETA